jgi:demethylmenaquinone methyltransferase/2-methoxy-6-polyprenyl-1,4-benzoquinol methylase
MKEPPARNNTPPAIADDPQLLAGQIAYYRARAAEYDAWWFRTGRFDRGAANNAAWRADVANVQRAVVDMLAATRPSSVLEPPAARGFSRAISRPRAGPRHRDRRGVRSFGINRRRVAAPNVRYVEPTCSRGSRSSNTPACS